MRKCLPILTLFCVVASGGCGTLVNLAAPASVWDDGQPKLLGGTRADFVAIQKCFNCTEDESDESHRIAVLVGCALVLDVPVSAAADVAFVLVYAYMHKSA